jgi:hypothetical protein
LFVDLPQLYGIWFLLSWSLWLSVLFHQPVIKRFDQLYITAIWQLWKESLNSIGQQFNKYQQNDDTIATLIKKFFKIKWN